MTVEEGSGCSGADSYASIETADAYHESRGNNAWAEAPQTARGAALVRACDYLERAYCRLWPGQKTTEGQRLSFPRTGMPGVDDGEIPPWLIEAQCEAALLELIEPGILAESPSHGGALLQELEGEVAYSYAPGPGSIRRFPSVHGLLASHARNPAQVMVGRA